MPQVELLRQPGRYDPPSFRPRCNVFASCKHDRWLRIFYIFGSLFFRVLATRKLHTSKSVVHISLANYTLFCYSMQRWFRPKEVKTPGNIAILRRPKNCLRSRRFQVRPLMGVLRFSLFFHWSDAIISVPSKRRATLQT